MEYSSGRLFLKSIRLLKFHFSASQWAMSGPTYKLSQAKMSQSESCLPAWARPLAAKKFFGPEWLFRVPGEF